MKEGLHLNSQDCVLDDWKDVGSCRLAPCVVLLVAHTQQQNLRRWVAEADACRGSRAEALGKSVRCHRADCGVQSGSLSSCRYCSATLPLPPQLPLHMVVFRDAMDAAAQADMWFGADCKMNEWTDWTACSAKCSGGTRTRERTTKSKAKNGGKACGEYVAVVACALVWAAERELSLSLQPQGEGELQHRTLSR